MEEGTGKSFVNQSKAEDISPEFASAVEAGSLEAMQGGILAGYPVDDIEITLLGGSFHEVDSTEQSFKIATGMAVREALKAAEVVLLEPIMDVEIVCPEEYVGEVISDLNSRRGRVLGFEDHKGSKIIKALVPLAETFGYATSLRSASQGRASFSMQIRNYAEVPVSKSKEIVAKRFGLSL